MSQSHALPSPQQLKQQPATDGANVPLARLLIALAGLSALVLVFVLAYVWFSGGNGQPSTPLVAPVLELREGDTRTRFSIMSSESEARFSIDEILLGNPYRVVGRTQDIAGEMLIDWENPTNSVLGAIRINLRTLRTDNEFRNRAIRGQILQSDQAEYEFAEFIPTALEGLPSSLAVGESVDFQIRGVLTVHGVSREVLFSVTLEALASHELHGLAQTTVNYRDFGMTIPEAAGVADVSETVQLELDFVAHQVDSATE